MPFDVIRQPLLVNRNGTYTRKDPPKPINLRGYALMHDGFIASGTGGRVYKVRGKDLAVKAIAKNGTLVEKSAEREATALRALKHPNIVEMKDFYEREEDYYITMELLTGGDLDPIAEAGGLPEEEVKPYLRQVISAVAFCHDNGIVHRDLKPGNLVFADASKKVVKLVDFGICEILPPSGNKPIEGQFGSQGYFAPEVLFANESYDGFKADAFSLGVVFIALVKGCSGGRYQKESWVEQSYQLAASPYRAFLSCESVTS